MTFTELVEQMQQGNILPIRLIGKSKYVFELIKLITYSGPFNPSEDYCRVVGEYYASCGGHSITNFTG